MEKLRRSIAKGGTHAFIAPADGSGASGVSNRVGMMHYSCV
jgi:hypothetical protein